ncbi:MAG: ATP-binding protein, partial [Acidimicrobiales bacterium]
MSTDVIVPKGRRLRPGTHPSGNGYSVGRIGPIPLLGRRGEVAALQALLDAARRGAGGVVVLEGEAGIGKTRLVDELVAAARRLGVTALVGDADEIDFDRPLAAFVEALVLSADSPDPERGELGRLVAGDDPGAAATAGDVGYRIVEALLGLVERLGTTGPHLLVVEDVHWADPLTVRALRAIGRRALQALPVGLVLTMRPFPRSAELDEVLDDLDGRGATRLTVEPLTEPDARALAVAVGGPDAAARAGVAGGNPLLLIELATSPVEDGELSPTVSATVLRRVRTLPPATVEAVKVASVLGRRFSFDQLALAMGSTPVDLLGALEDALAARVLVDDEGELSFRHDLIREAVYEDLSPALRRGVHRQVARALSDRGAPVAQVAEHLLASADPGDHGAIAWLAQAARVTAPRSPQTAVRMLERASVLAGPDHPLADTLAADLAPLLIQTGRIPEAERLTREVLARGPEPAIEA